jgi:methionyl aminopeptidase
LQNATLIRNTGPNKEAAIASTNPPKSAAASGLVEGTLEGQDDDADDDEEDDQAGADLNADGQTCNGE